MPSRHSKQILSFLWRHNEIASSIVDMADQTTTGAIFDVSEHLTGDTARALQSVGAKEIKISTENLMDPAIKDFLRQADVETLWAEYIPALTTVPPEAFLERLREFSDRFRCVPISGDLDVLTLALQSEWHPPAIALKGIEAAGFVSNETTGVIYATLTAIAGHRVRKPGLIVWGGVATPEAAAAFLCSGAEGIVFESLHWQTDLVSVDQNLKKRLSKLRPEHTTVVGHNLGVSCRFFDKGNSKAVKALKQFSDAQFGCEITDHERRTFARKIEETVIPTLTSELGRQDLVFLGPEAAFAEAFAERFGRTTRQAVATFLEEVVNTCWEAPGKLDGFVENSAAGVLGTRYPFIQGAMSWISDIPEFALAVAEAGGLPTLALGMKSRTELEKELGRLKEIMGERPYAINFLALPENPHLEEQLTWIEESLPPFAVIAAGDPGSAGRLQEKGIQTIYVASSEGLIRLALGAGVRFIVLEGNEAGGHVGEHTTLTLAQITLELRRREPALFRDCTVVLAGGIYDRETAFRAFMLGADAVQMGTAYLATEEIVSTGALSPLYQRAIVDSRPGMTTVSGESIGLRVRSLKTPTMDAICTLEREWASGQHDETSFRHRLEGLSVNSLLIAARGVDQPDGRALDEETCAREGQFMSGAIAGAVNRVLTLSAFHRSIAEGPMELTLPEREEVPSPPAIPATRERKNGERVAVTGMAMVSALGNSPKEIWDACLALKSGITEVSNSRWNHDFYYDPDPRARGKTYCRVGAFQNIDISRKELGIAPQDFRSMADATKLTLWLAEQVIRESGLLDSGIPRERIGVLVSQNSGESTSTITDLVFDVHANEIVRVLEDLIPMTPELERSINERIRSGRLTVDDTTLLGRLNCAAGGFVCNKYEFQGPSFSVSAACATGLVALYSAIQMIRNDIIDAAVVGGGEESIQPSHYLEFSALKALAGLSDVQRPVEESSRPFDATRDGMVLGEGGGMIVIERESVARQRGVPIHAFITGIGASNNDQGMVESLAETQMIALRASFKDAGYSPDLVDLVECHATSTMQGDVEEVNALKALFSSANGTMLASIKSQVGHTLGASGLISLIRGVTAMQAGIFPPTPTYRTRDPEIDLESAGFHVPVQPVEWPEPPDRPRRLQVNAFGFGGANYVVHLEACRDAHGRVAVAAMPSERPESIAPPEREEHADVEGVSFFTAQMAGRPYRLGVVASDETESRAKVEALEPVEPGASLTEKSLRVMARQGIFAAPADEPVEPLAFVFAGQGSQYIGMGKALYRTFPEIKKWMDRMAAAADFDLLDLLFNSTEEDLQKTRWQQPALYTMEVAMVQYLISLGVAPTAMAGHSLGELVALSIAGVFSHEDGLRIVDKRARCMDKAAGLGSDPGTMIAVDAPMEYLEEKIAGYDSVYFTNFNSPRQIVLGGNTKPVLALMEEIKKGDYRATQLKVSMAFHSPIMKVIHEEMADFVSGISFHPPEIPVISNTTMTPYPDDPDRIREILMAHLESPVHWMQNVRTLWDDFGIRQFVEIGPKDTLCNLVGETLEPALCIPSCMSEGEVHAYRSAVAHLYALGHLDQEGVPISKASERQRVETALPDITVRPPSDNRMDAIVQREINAFVLESFGRIIKPQILEAIRRELDPGFTRERLDHILGEDLPLPPPGTITGRIESAAAQPVTAAEPSVPPSKPLPQKEGEAVVDVLEQVIRIIMDATGYERDEIEPDMDLRQDLAIRSSRLPVIMDEVERQFNITVNVEDFMGLRTVGEIADRIEALAGPNDKTDPDGQPPDRSPRAPAAKVTDEPAEEDDLQKEPIRRLILEEVKIPLAPVEPLTLAPGQGVAMLSVGSGSVLAEETSRLLAEKFGARLLHMDCLGRDKDAMFDLRTAAGAENAAKRLKEAESLAGIVLVLEGGSESVLSEPSEISAFLTGFFGCLKHLTGSKNRAFCLCLLQGIQPRTFEAMTGEGILGMFLAAAQEYSSMLFRSVTLDTGTDVRDALDAALNTGNPLVQLICHDREIFSLRAIDAPLSLTGERAVELGAGDVIVITGGARGVTNRIARALAPFKPRVVLLGRTELDPDAAYGTLQNLGETAEKDAHPPLNEKGPGPEGGKPESETSKGMAGLDIARSVSRLSAMGLKVQYQSCDVADPRQVARTLGQVAKQYGRIDGIIHGAGLIKDAFMEFMTTEDFKQVVDVKLQGAWNLYRAAKDHGLRFFAGLSSIVAVQGNVGQVNYCAANRSLSALLGALASSREGLVTKALMLPPIEGTGMADDPEVKELMNLKGLASAFVHADAFAQMFCRELFLGDPQQTRVMLARTFPGVRGTLVEPAVPDEDAARQVAGGVCFRIKDLPMIEIVDELDLEKGELVARRTFSHAVDLWIEDHKPFKFLKHPLVSGIMAVETFLEAAHLLYPHLNVCGVRQLSFEDIMECPRDMEREARIICRRQERAGQEVRCDVRLSSADVSPSGRVLDRWSTNYRGQVILGPRPIPLTPLPDFEVKADDLDTRPVETGEVQETYEQRTGLRGRYRVLERIHGTGSGVVKGEMIYPKEEDMAGLDRVRYQYSPYLMEALMHLFALYPAMRREEVWDLIPAGMGEMRFARLARSGERCILEARLRSRDDQGFTWDARALDESGAAIMQVTSMRMNRFNP